MFSYEYDGSGKNLGNQLSNDVVNLFRFGTKINDSIDCLLYYGYRYYSSCAGRWIQRDPIYEIGFLLANFYPQDFNRNPVILPRRHFWKRESFNNKSMLVYRGNEGLYVAFANNPITYIDLFGLTSVAVMPNNWLIPTSCPDYCCKCNLDDVDELIESQKKIIKKLEYIIRTQGDLLPGDPNNHQLANAAGGRSEEYYNASTCIKVAIDRLENNFLRSLFDLLDISRKYAEMEIDRSKTLIQYLQEIKDICGKCQTTYS